jgi:hypothetical protein
MKLSHTFHFAAVLLVGAATVHAQPGADSSELHATAKRPDPTIAITVSPLHLVVPMAEVTAELRVAPRLGISVIGGIGRFHDQDTNEKIDLLEGGASIRYYVLGSFRTGLQVGGEVVYVHASTDDMSVDIKARGVGLAPFLGYKWTHGSGFTLEAQLGATYMAARADSATQTAKESKVGPMLNLNVGWSL